MADSVASVDGVVQQPPALTSWVVALLLTPAPPIAATTAPGVDASTFRLDQLHVIDDRIEAAVQRALGSRATTVTGRGSRSR